MWHPPPTVPPAPPGYKGHPHFWQRALSRRRFIQTAAGATAMVVGNGLWFPLAAAAGNHDDPTPVRSLAATTSSVTATSSTSSSPASATRSRPSPTSTASLPPPRSGARAPARIRRPHDRALLLRRRHALHGRGLCRRGWRTAQRHLRLRLTRPVHWPGGPGRQRPVHDYEPGIMPNGLFWTIPVPRSAVEIQPRGGHGPVPHDEPGDPRLPRLPQLDRLGEPADPDGAGDGDVRHALAGERAG